MGLIALYNPAVHTLYASQASSWNHPYGTQFNLCFVDAVGRTCEWEGVSWPDGIEDEQKRVGGGGLECPWDEHWGWKPRPLWGRQAGLIPSGKCIKYTWWDQAVSIIFQFCDLYQALLKFINISDLQLNVKHVEIHPKICFKVFIWVNSGSGLELEILKSIHPYVQTV